MVPAPDAFRAQFLKTQDGAQFRAAVFDAAPETSRRGDCLLLNGQSEFIEKYFEVIDTLRQRGFRVATWDWQNQGASPRPLNNPLKVHVRDFAEYDRVVETVLDQLIRPFSARPPVALAHSMGGHILIRALHNDPNAFRAAVLSAPMVGIAMRGLPNWLAGAMAAAMTMLGQGKNWVWGVNTRDPLTDEFDKNPVTSDRAHWDAAHDFLRAHPNLRVIGPTWSWLNAALHSMAEMQSPEFARRITTPTLIAGAGIDTICSTPITRRFADGLPNASYFELPGSKHEILMERDSIRRAFWSSFDAFVAPYV